MAKKKNVFTKKELSQLSAEEIIDKIQHENYSLLTSLGAEDLRREMVPVGKICNAIINYVFKTSRSKKPATSDAEDNSDLDDQAQLDRAARKRIVKILSRFTPGTYKRMPKDKSNGLVIGFNHPSLGEIARILAMKIDVMGDKPMYFPVNLPWYEALAPNYDKIRRLGIVITPTITPSTWKKMNLKEGSQLYEAGNRLKKEFRDLYTKISHDGLKQGGVVFVAPSATRQATVFKNEDAFYKREDIIPTMSVLALRLYKDPEMNCDFLPIAVLPPKNYKRGLNFRKKYTLTPGKIMTADYIKKTYFKTKNPEKLDDFDYDFHMRIAQQLPNNFWY